MNIKQLNETLAKILNETNYEGLVNTYEDKSGIANFIDVPQSFEQDCDFAPQDTLKEISMWTFRNSFNNLQSYEFKITETKIPATEEEARKLITKKRAMLLHIKGYPSFELFAQEPYGVRDFTTRPLVVGNNDYKTKDSLRYDKLYNYDPNFFDHAYFLDFKVIPTPRPGTDRTIESFYWESWDGEDESEDFKTLQQCLKDAKQSYLVVDNKGTFKYKEKCVITGNIITAEKGEDEVQVGELIFYLSKQDPYYDEKDGTDQWGDPLNETHFNIYARLAPIS